MESVSWMRWKFVSNFDIFGISLAFCLIAYFATGCKTTGSRTSEVQSQSPSNFDEAWVTQWISTLKTAQSAAAEVKQKADLAVDGDFAAGARAFKLSTVLASLSSMLVEQLTNHIKNDPVGAPQPGRVPVYGAGNGGYSNALEVAKSFQHIANDALQSDSRELVSENRDNRARARDNVTEDIAVTSEHLDYISKYFSFWKSRGIPSEDGGQPISDPNMAGGSFSRRFRCEPLNPLYSSLDSILKVTIVQSNGARESSDLTTLTRRSDCDDLAGQLNTKASRGDIAVSYCEPDQAQYRSLDSTLFTIIFEGSRTENRKSDHFSVRSACEDALRIN